MSAAESSSHSGLRAGPDPSDVPDDVLLSIEAALDAPDDAARDAVIAAIPAPWRDQALTVVRGRLDLLQEALAAATARDAPLRPPITAGRRLGAYELVERIGEGAQGVVFLARDLRLPRDVAIKVFEGQGPRAAARLARFRREAELASRLDHPGICTVFEAGEIDDRAYIAMRYVAGEPLSAVLARERSDGPPSRERITARLRLLERCARAAHAAHAAGVIHRDLKPGNIVVTPGQEPVILDFGLARDDDGTAALTQSGTPVGTPTYMSPEQVSPGRGPVDARTDVWSLGVMLFELMAGRPPFEAPSREGLYHAILTAATPDICALNPAAGRDVRVVISACLDKEPARRYATALDLADDLRNLIEGRLPFARPVTTAVRVARWTRRNPLVATLLLLVIVTLTVATAVSLRLLAEARTERDHTRESARVADGHRLVAQAQVLAGQSPGLATLLALEGDRRAGGSIAANALLRILDQPIEEQALIGHEGPVIDAIFTHDGRRCVTASSDGTVRIWEREHGAPLLSIELGSGRPTSLALSADDRFLAVGADDGSIHLLRAEDGTPVGAARRHAATVTGATFDPSGAMLATSSTDGTVILWRVPALLPMLKFTEHQSPVHSVDFDASAQRIVSTGANGFVLVWSVTTGEVHDRLHPDDSAMCDAHFSPDGDEIVAASADNNVWVWNLEAGVIARLSGHLSGVTGVGWNGSGRRIASSSADRSVVLWDPRESAAVATLTGHASVVRSVRFSSDGRRVITASDDQTARIWLVGERPGVFTQRGNQDVGTRSRASADGRRVVISHTNEPIVVCDAIDGTVIGRIVHPAADPLGIELCRDGQRVLAAMSDGTVCIWRVEGGRPLAVLGTPLTKPCRTGSATFSPDETRVLAAFDSAGATVYDVASGQRLCTVDGCGPFFNNGNGTRAVFDRSGERVITVSAENRHRTLVVSDARTGAELARLAGHQSDVICLAASPTGSIVASGGSDGALLLHDLDRPDHCTRLAPHKNGATSVAFDRTGQRLISAGRDNCARLHDVASGALVRTFGGHRAMIYQATLSPDGRQVATASWDMTAAIYDVETGARLLVQQGHGGPVFSAGFAADGQSVVTSSFDGSTRVWPVDPISVARRLIHRAFTSDECHELGLDPSPPGPAPPRIRLPEPPPFDDRPPER